ncbi:MAG: hypothetical protein Q4A25_01935 [Candidatus Saccharibacteria bacterium]|nr:hypothetical protein [Candidatus Saccharibacteria bacterium]
MVYGNKGNSSIKIDENGRIESLADHVLENNLIGVGKLMDDTYRLYLQFSVEGHLAVREQYAKDDLKELCEFAMEQAATRFFANIVPTIFNDLNEDGCGWEPLADARKHVDDSFHADIFCLYLEELPLAVAIYDADEYYQEGIELPIDIEAIEAVYVDEAVVSQLGLSEEEVGAYLDCLITKLMEKRFDADSDSAEMFRPTITIAKKQEGYFSEMAETYLWGRTEDEDEAGYIIFN